jgi:hypothetical protein
LDILLDIPFNVAGNQFLDFMGIVLKIWLAPHRWRSLCIITTAENLSAIQNSVGRKTPRWLESLELRVSRSESYSYSQPSLPFASMPSLKSLVLRGVSLKIPGVSSLVDHLENLDLFATSPALVMQLAEHFDASSRRTEAISCLRHLSLRSTPPQLHLSSAAFKSYISSLTTLTLGHFHHQDLQSFCRLLCTPLLEELALTNLSRMCWDSFATSLSDESLEFPALRTLKLSFISECTMHRQFATAFPALEHLSLLHVDCSPFLSALSQRDSILWPHLRSLTLNNADYRTLRLMVEARIALRCPLVALEVDSPRVAIASTLQWLQNHVKTFKRNRAA